MGCTVPPDAAALIILKKITANDTKYTVNGIANITTNSCQCLAFKNNRTILLLFDFNKQAAIHHERQIGFVLSSEFDGVFADFAVVNLNRVFAFVLSD